MANEDFIYRISTNQEWEEFQKNGSSFGGELDKSTGCFHLSKLNQVSFQNLLRKMSTLSSRFLLLSDGFAEFLVQSTLKNFFLNVKEDLYLLQVDPKKLGDGLIYEAVDEVNTFPHFYGPNKTFIPLPLDSVNKAEKLTLINGDFTCRFLT